MTHFHYQSIIWDKKKSEINFRGCFLGNAFKRFQVDGTKQIVFNGEKLFLCKVKVKTQKGFDELFKLFVIRDSDINNWNKEDIQMVGLNKNGQFIFDKEFEEGMKKVSETAPFINLSSNEERPNSSNTGNTRLRKNPKNGKGD